MEEWRRQGLGRIGDALKRPQVASESFIALPAVGAEGLATPLSTFLNLDQITGQMLP